MFRGILDKLGCRIEPRDALLTCGQTDSGAGARNPWVCKCVAIIADCLSAAKVGGNCRKACISSVFFPPQWYGIFANRFSGPVIAGELKPKRQPEWNKKPAGEMQEAPEVRGEIQTPFLPSKRNLNWTRPV